MYSSLNEKIEKYCTDLVNTDFGFVYKVNQFQKFHTLFL